MISQKSINKRFTDLCALLGRVEFQLTGLKERRSAILAEIRSIDATLPAIVEAEKSMQQETLQAALAAEKLASVKPEKN